MAEQELETIAGIDSMTNRKQLKMLELCYSKSSAERERRNEPNKKFENEFLRNSMESIELICSCGETKHLPRSVSDGAREARPSRGDGD